MVVRGSSRYSIKKTDAGRVRVFERLVGVGVILVVIILLFGSFGGVRDGSRDAMIKQHLSTIRTKAILGIDSRGNYPEKEIFCTNVIGESLADLEKLSPEKKGESVICESGRDDWYVYVRINKEFEGEVSGVVFDGYCADSSGYIGPVYFGGVSEKSPIDRNLCRRYE
jgi:hypothetical protein